MNNDTAKIITPLGLALHNARLKASLSVEQVAKLLNLNESAVRELEGDISVLIESRQYAPIYLRGYLANYAKLVALKSIDEFIEYQQLSKPQARDCSIRATASMLPAGKKRLIPLWLLVVLVLIAILAAVFAQQSGLFFAKESATTVTAESSEDAENKPFNPVVIDKETLPELKETAVDEIIIEPVIQNTIDPASSADQINTEDKSAALENKEPLDTSPKAIAASLYLSFSGDCWTEIYDATGKRLAFGLYAKDDSLSIEGIAPFKMKLGDPSVVAIKYQDKIIERAFTAGQAMQFYIPA
ncbi:MAG TPA: RodZ domain-containing protein [Psychromonas sp.]